MDEDEQGGLRPDPEWQQYDPAGPPSDAPDFVAADAPEAARGMTTSPPPMDPGTPSAPYRPTGSPWLQPTAPGPAGRPSPPPLRRRRPPRRATPLVLGTLLALGMIGGTIGWVNSVVDPASDRTTSTSTTSTSAPTYTPYTPTPEPPDPVVEPVVPGWVTVVSPNEWMAYDVPPDTVTPKSPGLNIGYGAPGVGLVGIHRVAEYLTDSCSKASGSSGSAAIMGFGQRQTGATDLEDRAVQYALQWADAINTPDGSDRVVPVDGLPTTSEVTLGGGLEGIQATMEFPQTHSSNYECTAPGYRLTVVAAWHPTQPGTSVTFVVVSFQGVERALPVELERQILAHVRPID